MGADGRLSVVTVVEVGTFDAEREAVGSLIEDEHSVRSAHLERLCETTGSGTADRRVLVGKVSAEIAAHAGGHGCDLVVLGEHEDRPSRPGLGSTTDATVRLLACDALVVKTPSTSTTTFCSGHTKSTSRLPIRALARGVGRAAARTSARSLRSTWERVRPPPCSSSTRYRNDLAPRQPACRSWT